jgi:C4-dicarboxylate-specific signal transduction histidine kinase
VDIAVQIDKEIYVRMDHGLLEQVLINLLVNAVHAVAEACNSGRTDNHFVRLTAYEKDHFVYFQISDTGKGIRPNDQKQLFRAFFTTKPVGEGTGLGLYISAQIINDAGGELSLYDSQEGVGTTFQLRLPAPAH